MASVERKSLVLTKLFGLIRRRDDLPPEEFHDHYRHPHGTMGLGLEFLSAFRRRCASDVHTFEVLLSRGDPVLTILVHAERYI